MKKILIYTENYEYGGVERFLFDVALNYKNHKLLITANSGNDRVAQFAAENKIPFCALDIKNAVRRAPYSANARIDTLVKNTLRLVSPFRKYWHFLRNYFYLRARFKAWLEYDNLYIINGGYPAADSCRALSIAGKQLGFKNIVHVILSCPTPGRNWPVIKQLESYIDAKVVAGVDLFQPNAEKIKTELISMKGFPAEKIRAVHTGVSLPRETAKLGAVRGITRKEGEIWLGMVAFLGALKGHKFLLEALKSVKAALPTVKCLLVGDGPERAGLEALAKNLGLGDTIVFAGHYDNNTVSEAYCFMDLFVFSSLHEGLPYAVSEAMSYSLPVIATSVGGVPEQVEDSVNGYLVQPANAASLASAIIKTAGNPQNWPRLGQSGWEKAAECFSIESMLKEVDNILV